MSKRVNNRKGRKFAHRKEERPKWKSKTFHRMRDIKVQPKKRGKVVTA